MSPAVGQRLASMMREYRLTLFVIAVLVVGYLVLRTSPSDIGSADAFLASLEAGQPTVVEFYSNR